MQESLQYIKTQRQCLLVEQSVEDGQSKMPIEQLSYVFGLSSILIKIQANKRTLVHLSHYTPIIAPYTCWLNYPFPSFSQVPVYIYTYIIYIYANAHESSLPPGSFQE